LGKIIKKSLRDFFLFISFFIEIFVETSRIWKTGRTNLTIVVRQILFTGVEALPIITFVALGVGGLIILQGYNLLSNFGQGGWIHMILVTVVIRELSGILTALIVVARSGTAISTELGIMVVNKEIDLLKSFNISPLSYLVAPRVIGVIVAIFTLTIYFNVTAIIGGWLFTTMFMKTDILSFLGGFASIIQLNDIIISIIKSIVFGYIIAMISCYQGLQVQFAMTEVPQRTIRAVVHALILVILFDILITLGFYYIT